MDLWNYSKKKIKIEALGVKKTVKTPERGV